MTASLDHVGVVVSDLDRALGFWRDLLGLPVTGQGEVDWPHLSDLNGLPGVVLRWCTLAVGTSVIELTVYASGPLAGPREGEDEPGRAHVGIVVSDLDGLARRLRAAGIRLRSGSPVPITAGSYQGWRALYALDPDGTSVELFERPAGGKEAGGG